LSPAEISSLFVVWSATTFLLEVPSGAWADVVSRRALLAASAVVNGVGYAVWVAWPGYAGFLLGFVLWGVSSALASGTFEAFTYDELAAAGRERRYAQVIGWTTSAGLVGLMLSNLAAAPLILLGGIELTGWVSLGVCCANALVAHSLPPARRRTETADVTGDAAIDEGHGLLGRWVAMLRAGTREATTHAVVRRGVVLTALMYGFLAFDEYFGLVFADLGATTALVAMLTAVTAAAQALGGVLAGPAAVLSARTLGLLTAGSAVLIGAGSALSLAPAVIGISIGYGVLQLVLVVTEARMQDSIAGPARATVTSVAGLGSEVLAMALYAGFALGSVWFGYAALVTLFALAPLAVAGLFPRWLPSVVEDTGDAGEDGRGERDDAGGAAVGST
jgi:hypothetical protein